MNTQQATQQTMNPMTVRAQEPMAWRLRSVRSVNRRVTRRHKARVIVLLVGSLACAAVQTAILATGLIHAVAAQAVTICR